jgi:hypothetical protein
MGAQAESLERLLDFGTVLAPAQVVDGLGDFPPLMKLRDPQI